jgi:hypothetical protein
LIRGAVGRRSRGDDGETKTGAVQVALATPRLADEPLLCVGDDFALTDLELA